MNKSYKTIVVFKTRLTGAVDGCAFKNPAGDRQLNFWQYQSIGNRRYVWAPRGHVRLFCMHYSVINPIF